MKKRANCQLKGLANCQEIIQVKWDTTSKVRSCLLGATIYCQGKIVHRLLTIKQNRGIMLDIYVKLAVAPAQQDRIKEKLLMTLKLSIATIDRLELPTSTRMTIIDASTDPQIQSIADAFDAVILGQDVSATKSEETVVDAGGSTVPTSELCNRGDKWLLRFQDSVKGNKYTHELGTADYTQLPSSTSDNLDLTAGVGLALKNALDAVYESPLGNTGVLLSVQQVTRTD